MKEVFWAVGRFLKGNLPTVPKDIFSRKRHLQIFWASHVSPPLVTDAPNRSMQARSSKLRNVCSKQIPWILLYRPSQFLSAGEAAITFKGKIEIKLYNPQKPKNWRIYSMLFQMLGMGISGPLFHIMSLLLPKISCVQNLHSQVG